MSQKIAFHLDEHIDSAIAEGLRRRGIDVTMSTDVGLRGAPDEEHLDFAFQSGRILVTQDRDFLRLHSIGAPHAGIAYCKQRTRSVGAILRALIVIYESFTPNEVKGQVLYL